MNPLRFQRPITLTETHPRPPALLRTRHRTNITTGEETDRLITEWIAPGSDLQPIGPAGLVASLALYHVQMRLVLPVSRLWRRVTLRGLWQGFLWFVALLLLTACFVEAARQSVSVDAAVREAERQEGAGR